ncbi:hypothetical protein CYMTET_50534 [Cymbomonas tetramitiformis]|uniref:Transcription initiation factor IIA subunit 2 n=1 Tax=Cymbomonas tetramitiformis TaxID=36881 RepID=A0AAE0BMX5_9CHLO|nr:hypothetical protein CYMTET_50534 [Cymbomonas tetramitiformis]
MEHWQLYRASSIGTALQDALDEMVQDDDSPLSPELAMKTVMQFDKAMNELLAERVKSKLNFKGHLHTYRFCDNVWQFILEDAEFKLTIPGVGGHEIIKADKAKIFTVGAAGAK